MVLISQPDKDIIMTDMDTAQHCRKSCCFF